jgi:hypothetical protein
MESRCRRWLCPANELRLARESARISDEAHAMHEARAIERGSERDAARAELHESNSANTRLEAQLRISVDTNSKLISRLNERKEGE